MNWLCRTRLVVLSGLMGTAIMGGVVRAAEADANEQKVRGSAVAFRQNREVLILYKPGQEARARQQAEQSGFEILENYTPGHFLRCAPKPGAEAVSARVNKVATSEAVQTVEPNFLVSIPRPPTVPAARADARARGNQPKNARQASAAATPDDPKFSELWGMQNIHAPLAWEKNHDSDVVVAVIDTGVDYTHKDLKDNMWRNPGESGGGKESNGIDDDGNGIKDDVFGAKFVNGTNTGDPKDDNEHGTHCAGTIGAVGNNHTGVVGVNWQAKIMALKVLDHSGPGATPYAVRCIDYAIAQKVKGVNIKVLSNSWGGGGDSQALREAITRAEQAGLLFVAAAGNSGTNNDTDPNFPSNYPNDNILAVAAIDIADQKPTFSCFGLTTVDLGAPGVGILSSIPNNGYDKFNGTSMATPHVAGAAALAMAHPEHKSKSAVEIKNLLMQKARPIASLSGKCVTGGTLDIAFLGVGTTPGPIFPENLAYTGHETGLGGTFLLNGSTGEAFYCLGSDFYRTQLEAKGVETTPDGFEGFVYREDFPNLPFDFLFTKATIGGVSYHRIYARIADGSNPPFAWFVDVAKCSVVTPANANGTGSRRQDALKEHLEKLKRHAEHGAAQVSSTSR